MIRGRGQVSHVIRGRGQVRHVISGKGQVHAVMLWYLMSVAVQMFWYILCYDPKEKVV